MAEELENELKHVGKVMDAHGIKGDIYCLIFSGDLSWLKKIKSLNLKLKDNWHEFKIKKTKEFKKGFIATLEGFDSRNQAEAFKGADLWVASNVFVSKNGEALYLLEILNFLVEDEALGLIGHVKSFSSNGSQDLLIINKDDIEYDIPFVKEFIVEMDFVNKKIITNLPEGLLEINTTDED